MCDFLCLLVVGFLVMELNIESFFVKRVVCFFLENGSKSWIFIRLIFLGCLDYLL